MKTSIGISETNRGKVAAVLNILLADEHVLYIKTRNAHWNVEGPDFYAQHKFFEDQYNQLAEMIDEIAERIRSLGVPAIATLKQYVDATNLKENVRQKNDSSSFITALLNDHESIINYIRPNIEKCGEDWKDEGTADFLTGIMEAHEKMAWMLRAHVS